jgi:1,4-dihydroxy-2-naphthoyl-CoA hydrolase
MATRNLDELNDMMMPFAKLLGIKLTRAEADLFEAEMEVRDDLCTLPAILHGGALMAFADTLGGIGAFANMGPDNKGTATIESKTTFIAAAPAGGKVIGRCTPLHKGRRTQVWQTRIETSEGKLVGVVTQTQIMT